jgi:hypothetical protein
MKQSCRNNHTLPNVDGNTWDSEGNMDNASVKMMCSMYD